MPPIDAKRGTFMDMNRRTFVAMVGAMTGACAIGGCAADRNSVGPAAAKKAEGPMVDVGTLADYSRDGGTDQFARGSEVIVARRGDRIFAVSAACTHRECIVRNSGDDLRCPCHGSRFNYDGSVTRGPATRPLIHFAISNENGRLVVDKSQVFTDMSDPASFVSVQAHPSTGASA
jgi:nitrite reductase/ring-hydroxylating ferredoxin subunit